MQVNFFATFRNIIGKKTVYFDLTDNIPVAEFLQAVIDAFPELKKPPGGRRWTVIALCPFIHQWA
jgi:molybdopterin converting factor small subunit